MILIHLSWIDCKIIIEGVAYRKGTSYSSYSSKKSTYNIFIIFISKKASNLRIFYHFVLWFDAV